MKVKMNTLSAGPDGVKERGKTYEVSAKEAKSLISGGYAEAVKEQAKAVVEDAGTQSDSGASGGTGDVGGDKTTTTN